MTNIEDVIITELAGRETEIDKVKDVYMELPESEPDDLAAALAARIFFDTRMFSSFSSSLEMTRKLCCEDDHGVCIYQVWRLTQAPGYKMDLDHLRVIMFAVLSYQIRRPLDLASLDWDEFFSYKE